MRFLPSVVKCHLILATAFLSGGLVAAAPVPADLPRPGGLKTVIETPHTAVYQAPGSADSTRNDAEKALLSAGWEPYGHAGETRYFKKGTVRVLVTVTPPPAPDGPTMVTYATESMSADLPLPSGVTEVQYSDRTKHLGFTTVSTAIDLAADYGKLLAPAGWFTRMEQPDKDGLDWIMVYRHPTEGKIQLAMRPGEGTVRAAVTYQTQQEVDAEEARSQKQGDKLRAKFAAEAAAPPPEVHLVLPEGTTKHFAVKNGYAIVLKPGAAREGAEKIRKALQEQGWAPGQFVPLVKETGMMELTRDQLRLTITYMDPGVLPAEITIAAPNIVIKAKP